MRAIIEGIGTYKLILDIGCHVDLEGCLYVPRCFKNLVYVAKLDELGFSFKIGNNVFFLFMDMYYHGYGTLIDCLNLDVKFMESLFNAELMLVVSEMCMMIVLLICGIKIRTHIQRKDNEVNEK